MFCSTMYIYTICTEASEVTTFSCAAHMPKASFSLGFLALSSLRGPFGRQHHPSHRYAAKFSDCACNLVFEQFCWTQVASVLAVPIRYLSVPLLKLECAAWLALCSLLFRVLVESSQLIAFSLLVRVRCACYILIISVESVMFPVL